MTTEECLIEIESKMDSNFRGTGERYAVLKPQSKYEGVDWDEVKKSYPDFEIHGYNQGDKIVISKL